MERAGSITVDQHIGLTQQPPKALAIGGRAQIEARTALAERHFGNHRAFVPIPRINAEYLGAIARQKPRRYGSGQHASQIQNPDSFERTRGRERPVRRGSARGVRQMRQRLAVDRASLRMTLPFARRAHLGGTSAGADDRALEFAFGPSRDRRCHAGAISLNTQYALAGGAMPRRIGMQSDPAVGGAIIARDRIPDWRRLPSERPQ